MIIAKLRALKKLRIWKELGYNEKRNVIRRELQIYFGGYSTYKEKAYFLANFIYPYYFDGVGNKEIPIQE